MSLVCLLNNNNIVSVSTVIYLISAVLCLRGPYSPKLPYYIFNLVYLKWVIYIHIAKWLILMTFFWIWLTKDEIRQLNTTNLSDQTKIKWHWRICAVNSQNPVHKAWNWLTIDEIEINKRMFRFFQDEIEWSKNGFERTLCEFDRENLY